MKSRSWEIGIFRTMAIGGVMLIAILSATPIMNVTESGAAATPTPTKKSRTRKKMKSNTTPTPTPARKALAEGVWGANGARLTVTADRSVFEFGCSAAEISGPIEVSGDGSVEIGGFLLRRRPGPERVDEEPQRLPVRFVGNLKEKFLSLKMILTESGETVDEYQFEQGRNVRVQRCL